MEAHKRIKVKEVVDDLRSGTPTADLQRKYKLSRNGLAIVLQKLVDAKVVSQSDLEDWRSFNHDVTVIRGVREEERVKIDFALVVQDSDFPYAKGFVRDVSEKGLGTSGITARVGETKALVLHLDRPGHQAHIKFHALCRWVAPSVGGHQGCMAGFEITHIEDVSLTGLRKLLEKKK
ncbi:MAG: PilZ domain-containing protein [Desulfomonilaceae bacterium]